MSLYRSIIVAVAAMGLATTVFAADENTNSTDNTATKPAQVAVASNTDSTQMTEEKVDLNKATAKELMKVKGLNSAKAKAIVAHRKKHGEFKSVDDLKEVKGFKKMKEDTLKSIQDQLTVG